MSCRIRHARPRALPARNPAQRDGLQTTVGVEVKNQHITACVVKPGFIRRDSMPRGEPPRRQQKVNRGVRAARSTVPMRKDTMRRAMHFTIVTALRVRLQVEADNEVVCVVHRSCSVKDDRNAGPFRPGRLRARAFGRNAGWPSPYPASHRARPRTDPAQGRPGCAFRRRACGTGS